MRVDSWSKLHPFSPTVSIPLDFSLQTHFDCHVRTFHGGWLKAAFPWPQWSRSRVPWTASWDLDGARLQSSSTRLSRPEIKEKLVVHSQQVRMETLEACNQREKCAESQDSHNFSAKTMWFVTLCVNEIEPMIVSECSCQSAGPFLSLGIGTGRNNGGL